MILSLFSARPPRSEATLILEALEGPACLAAVDGSILAANPVCGGDNSALRDACPLRGIPFAALNTARANGRGEATIRLGEATHGVLVTGAGERMFLVRVTAPPRDVAARDSASFDVFTWESPFGAALIAGPDPFAGDILEVNAALAAIAGENAKPGARLADLITIRSLAEARAASDGGRTGPFEVSLEAAPDRTAHLYVTAAADGALIYLQDVTEQKQLQSRLAQRNRMESVGQLAGGVAHDFNNLLTAIRLRADELLLRHSLGDPSYDSLAEIRETVDRAAAVVRQLLTFSRKATLQREIVDLGEALTDTAVLLRRLVREDVALDIDYGANLPLVRIDRSQLETAIINLVVNARDALRAKGGGLVRIATARLGLEAAKALGYAGVDLPELALLEVADDGPGIAQEALAKIFEPFFTTKPLGEGTGLGLASVYGIVKQSEGWITAVSKPGRGRCFASSCRPTRPLWPSSPRSGRSRRENLPGTSPGLDGSCSWRTRPPYAASPPVSCVPAATR